MVDACNQFINGPEVQILDGFLIGLDFVGLEIEQVDHTEVNLADFVGVVVDEADDFLCVSALDDELFLQFAFNGVVIGGGAETVLTLVVGVDVSANTDALFGVETFLARLATAGIDQKAVLMAQDVVRDDLFMGRIKFRIWAWQEEVRARSKDGIQVMIGIGREPLEGPELIQQ